MKEAKKQDTREFHEKYWWLPTAINIAAIVISLAALIIAVIKLSSIM